MNQNPKVLVASPLYDGMNYCIKEFLNSIKSLAYNNYDVLLVDNSKTDDFFNELKKERGIKVIKDNTKEKENIQRLVSSRNKILQYALDNNHEFVLMMDSDVLPPPNIIEELLNCKKDIVGGLYFNYFQSSGITKLLPVAWAFITPEEFEEIKNKVDLAPSIKSHLDLRRHLTQEEIKTKELLKVRYPSAGCVLLSKKVFEKVKYGILEMPQNLKTSDEIYFFDKAHELGFECFCHTKIKCRHLTEGKYKKDKDGNLIHPLYT